MQVTTKAVTTKTHTAVFSGDEVKAALINIAKKAFAVTDASAPSKVDIATDGTVTVEVVEETVDAGADAEPAVVTTPAAAPAAPAAAPAAHAPSFVKPS